MDKKISSLTDIKEQIGTKRRYEGANSEIFSRFSSKSDLYDYMRNHLQVSLYSFRINIFLVLYASLPNDNTWISQRCLWRIKEANEIKGGKTHSSAKI